MDNGMQATKLRYALPLLLLALPSCGEKPDPKLTQFTQELVVEGSIETGRFSRVFITRNIPYYVQLDSADFMYLMIRQASVFVSDGERQEALTLRYDENLFPPFYYQGTQIRGEAGKTYSLTINHGSETQLRATTTLPPAVQVDSIWFQPIASNPERGTINLRIINPNTGYHYRILTMIQSEQSRYYPTLIANFSAALFNDSIQILSLRKGPESYMELDSVEYYFSSSDTIHVKVCTMDDAQLEFWSSYQQEVAGGSNPFTASARSLVSNIEGGLGNWGGYGVTLYKFIPGVK